MMGLGCTLCGREEPWVDVVQEEDGSYRATLCGHFTLSVRGDHPFRIRLPMLFLRLLEVPGPRRGGRRTRWWGVERVHRHLREQGVLAPA